MVPPPDEVAALFQMPSLSLPIKFFCHKLELLHCCVNLMTGFGANHFERSNPCPPPGANVLFTSLVAMKIALELSSLPSFG